MVLAGTKRVCKKAEGFVKCGRFGARHRHLQGSFVFVGLAM